MERPTFDDLVKRLIQLWKNGGQKAVDMSPDEIASMIGTEAAHALRSRLDAGALDQFEVEEEILTLAREHRNATTNPADRFWQ